MVFPDLMYHEQESRSQASPFTQIDAPGQGIRLRMEEVGGDWKDRKDKQEQVSSAAGLCPGEASSAANCITKETIDRETVLNGVHFLSPCTTHPLPWLFCDGKCEQENP
jgi:hypothetical protein